MKTRISRATQSDFATNGLKRIWNFRAITDHNHTFIFQGTEAQQDSTLPDFPIYEIDIGTDFLK